MIPQPANRCNEQEQAEDISAPTIPVRLEELAFALVRAAAADHDCRLSLARADAGEHLEHKTSRAKRVRQPWTAPGASDPRAKQ